MFKCLARIKWRQYFLRTFERFCLTFPSVNSKTNMAAEHQYFYEDEVYRINKKGCIEFGMVLENSESVSSDESSDNEDGARMKKGYVRVMWHPSGVEEVVQEKKIGLSDRSLMPGDVVRRLIPGKDTQRGYCRNIHVTACVQVVGTKQVIINVNSQDLEAVEAFAPDVVVCLDSWVGTIKTVRSKLQIAFADGSKCVITDVEASAFEELDESHISEYESPHHYDYHPGQVLYGPMEALEEAVWINCTKEVKTLKSKSHKNVKVVVEKVETDSVTVNWQCHAYSPDGTEFKEQPNYVIQGDELKKLKLLDVFEPCALQIGDRVYYTYKESDTVMSKDQWKSQRKQILLEKSPYLPKFHVKHKGNKENKAHKEKEEVNSKTITGKCPAEVVKDSRQMKVTDVPPSKDWETDDCASQDETASISSVYSSNSSLAGEGGGGGGGSVGVGVGVGVVGRKKKGPTLMTKVLKFKKLRRSRRKTPSVVLKPNTKIIVETLAISSTADVVWQDGTVELNIPSIDLYPIHHLDDQEFFPGDFVMENKEDGCLRVYGVVQRVDHAGRIAVVNWFHTYTSSEDPNPIKLDQSEVSVYDLKDHPDFQYRPGTVTIRVANFEGEDATCTAGQVLDNYPEGRVNVCWVDGHVSMCWPQDLYKVGDYDGELWDDASSEGSWETESEGSFVAEEDIIHQSLKCKLAANIEKARIVMSRLEELFTQNPALQTLDIMKNLLEVYKNCRYLDKLMGTSFFHENNFRGLLERVREKGRASVGSKVAEQVSRLFQISNDNPSYRIPSERIILSYDFDKDKTKSLDADMSNFIQATETCLDDGNALNFSKILPEIAKGVNDNAENNKVIINNELNNEKTKQILDINGDITEEIDRVNKTIDNLSDTLNKEILEQSTRNLNNLEIDSLEISKVNSTVNSKLKDDKVDEITSKAGNQEDECCNNAEKSPGSANGQLIQSSSADDSGVFEHSTASADTTSTDNCNCCSKTYSQNLKVQDTSETQGNDKVQLDPKKASYIIAAAGTKSLHSQFDKRTSGKAKYQIQSIISPLTLDKEAQLDSNSNDCNPSQVCAKLCALIKSQLVKAHAEVTRRFQGDKIQVTLSEVDSENITSPNEPKTNENEIVGEDQAKEEKTEISNKEEKVELRDFIRHNNEGFSIMSNAPNSHKYKLTMCQMSDPKLFFKTIKKELTLLKHSLPPGIWVKGFEDRTDLYSVMIRGPEKTPYEDGLFVFDFQLPSDYPRAPPLCHYLSYCSDRLNPNLYEDGKVCISLLGTWSGKGTEVWTLNSNLLQVIVSIQGLILVNEPYFNEAGYEKQKGSQQGQENSRMYNEMAILKLVQAMTKMYIHPPEVFVDEIKQHFIQNTDRFVERLKKWLDISERHIHEINQSLNEGNPAEESNQGGDKVQNSSDANALKNDDLQNRNHNVEWENSLLNLETVNDQPEFPLLPASKGFCLTLRKTLAAFRNIVEAQSS